MAHDLSRPINTELVATAIAAVLTYILPAIVLACVSFSSLIEACSHLLLKPARSVLSDSLCCGRFQAAEPMVRPAYNCEFELALLVAHARMGFLKTTLTSDE